MSLPRLARVGGFCYSHRSESFVEIRGNHDAPASSFGYAYVLHISPNNVRRALAVCHPYLAVTTVNHL